MYKNDLQKTVPPLAIGELEHEVRTKFNLSMVIPTRNEAGNSVSIIGGWGLALPTPMHLSQDQSIEVPMISYLDMTVLVSIPLLFALLLLFTGRPKILLAMRHPSRFKELLNVESN